MKKFVILLFAVLALCAYGCSGTSDGASINLDTDNMIVSGAGRYALIELTFNGETHEYVIYRSGYSGSVSHWEGCKYCKEKHQHETAERDTIYIVEEKDYNNW